MISGSRMVLEHVVKRMRWPMNYMLPCCHLKSGHFPITHSDHRTVLELERKRAKEVYFAFDNQNDPKFGIEWKRMAFSLTTFVRTGF